MRMVIIAALLLSAAACASAARDVTALGYPVTVDHDGDHCKFLIQDMWMSDVSMVERWFTALPKKPDQIDVVWSDDQDRRCIDAARGAVERAGFTSIVVRQGSPDDYPDLLRSTATYSGVSQPPLADLAEVRLKGDSATESRPIVSRRTLA